VRYYDADTDGSADTHYYLQDANFNVTAVVDGSAAVLDRYQYSPYGQVTFLEPDFDVAATQASAIGNTYLYTGRERDPETGLQLNRHRYYASHLGRWLTRDPVGYQGGMNMYAYLEGQVLIDVDPFGLDGYDDDEHPDDPADVWVCERPIRGRETRPISHLYVVIERPGGGDRRGFRGGPGPCPNSQDECVEVEYADYRPRRFTDYQPPGHRNCRWVHSNRRSYSEISECLQNLADDLNDLCLPYEPIWINPLDPGEGANSNSVIYWALTKCINPALPPRWRGPRTPGPFGYGQEPPSSIQ
jgi:RHS repeat-associated protein